jgi:hypothetical protein
LAPLFAQALSRHHAGGLEGSRGQEAGSNRSARCRSAVAGADLRLLSELVSKSVVRRPDFGRYELHELLRQYATEKLADESPDALASTRESRARHYLGALAERRGALVGKSVVQARDELRREVDNLRSPPSGPSPPGPASNRRRSLELYLSPGARERPRRGPCRALGTSLVS